MAQVSVGLRKSPSQRGTLVVIGLPLDALKYMANGSFTRFDGLEMNFDGDFTTGVHVFMEDGGKIVRRNGAQFLLHSSHKPLKARDEQRTPARYEYREVIYNGKRAIRIPPLAELVDPQFTGQMAPQPSVKVTPELRKRVDLLPPPKPEAHPMGPAYTDAEALFRPRITVDLDPAEMPQPEITPKMANAPIPVVVEKPKPAPEAAKEPERIKRIDTSKIATAELAAEAKLCIDMLNEILARANETIAVRVEGNRVFAKRQRLVEEDI